MDHGSCSRCIHFCQKPNEGKDKYGVSPPVHLTLYEACGRDSMNEFYSQIESIFLVCSRAVRP